MANNQVRICDCWMRIGGCFCELNIKSNEGTDIDRNAEKNAKPRGTCEGVVEPNAKSKRHLGWDARDLEKNGWISRSPRQAEEGEQFRFWE